MLYDNKIWIAQSENSNLYLLPGMANRHGLIAGATGTGKTVTMKVLAEAFSDMGVPVFFSDVKGDLTGMCKPGESKMAERAAGFGIEDFKLQSYPTAFWDIFGEVGHPARVTVSSLGPTLIGRLLGLTDIQTGVLNIVFKVADDQGLLLLDLKDLRAMVQYVGENRAEYTVEYGNVSAASIGAIQRALLALEDEGGDILLGEPALDLLDFMRTDTDGRGYINILESSKIVGSAKVYSTFLLWMLSDLFEKLPEVGDVEKPKMVFFFDEAHLIFEDAPKSLVSKIEQTVKLIRSKGVGVYFVTQNPQDIPSSVLAQVSNRIQHALRAYTPDEQKAVRAAARAFRVNSAFKTEDVITELAVGEALVSLLNEDGVPCIVERAKILPPQSYLGAADADEVDRIIAADRTMERIYRTAYDNPESAYEKINEASLILKQQAEEAAAALAAQKEAEKEAAAAEKAAAKEAAAAEKAAAKEAAAAEKAAAKEAAAAEKEAAKKKQKVTKAAEKAVNSAASSVARSVSSNIVNSLTGGKTVSAATIGKRAATNALSSVMRSGTSAIVRGLFGNKK